MHQLMLTDKALDGDGEDLVAIEAGDHALDAALDVHEAVFINGADVARVDPYLAVGVLPHDVVGLVYVLVVALHHGFAGDTDLAGGVIAKLLARFGVEDANGGGDTGDAHASLLVAVVDAEGSGGGDLTHAVALSQGIADVVRVHKGLHFGLQAGVHGVTTGAEGENEGQVKVLHLLAIDEDLVEGGGGDHMLGLVLLDVLAHLEGQELGNEGQLQAEGQGHVDAAHQAVGGEDGHNAQEALAALFDDAGVNEVEGNRIHAVVGQHNALGEAGGAARVGDGRDGVTLVGGLDGDAVLGALDEGVPADDAALTEGNGIPACKLHGELLHGRKRGGSRLDDDVLLVDLRQDLRDLGIGDINGQQDGRAGVQHHAGDALNVHAGVDGVNGRSDLVQCIQGNNGLRRGSREQGDGVSLLNTESGKGVCALIDAVYELLNSDDGSVVVDRCVVQTIFIHML